MVWDTESKVLDRHIVIWKTKKKKQCHLWKKETVFSIPAEDKAMHYAGVEERLIVYKIKDNKNFEFVSGILNYKKISSK